VMRLGLPENLERVLSSTNLIENLFGRVREIGRRVKRWQNGTMVLRWAPPACSKPSGAFANSWSIVPRRSWSPRYVPMMLSSSANPSLTLRIKPLNRLCRRYSIPTAHRTLPALPIRSPPRQA
jgi:hypothetical protein